MEKIFDKFKNIKVLVIGDIILDKYYYSDVQRISPEAPVPIAKYSDEKSVLGGAGNVALNLSKLGVQTSIIGKIGDDENAKIISNLFSENNINFIPIQVKSPTITKIRIVSKFHQLLRLDFENSDFYFNSSNSIFLEKLEKVINTFDIIIVSDYQKGVINSDLINYLSRINDNKINKKNNKYIAIDTKPGSFKNFKGFSLVKPNFNEAVGIAKYLGFNKNLKNINSDVEELGIFLKEKLNSNVLITRSENGASFIGNNNIYHSNIKKSEIIDVTGAGDTCISIFSILDYLNIEKGIALNIMNLAAKIAVSKFGTYAPSIAEIKNEFFLDEFKNIIEYENIEKIVGKLKRENKKIVFTNGCFDLLHRGHIDYLNKAKNLGDVLIVGLNSDSSVKKLKGEKRPIIDEESRAFVLSNLKSVDYVVIFDDLTPINLIKKIKPDIHVKGGDYTKESLPETPIIESFGGKVKIIKADLTHSTSNIIKKINDKY